MRIVNINSISSLKAKVASWLEPGCAVEDGEYGPRLVPSGEWSERHVKFMTDHNLKEIHFNRERGFSSNGDYAFLERMAAPLLGMKIVDYEAINLAPCYAHAESLRSLDISFAAS